MNVEYNLVVDFARPNKSNTIIISEGDVNSRELHFTLLANKQPMDMIDVSTATVRGIKSDGSTIFGDAEIVVDKSGNKLNELIYTIPKEAADLAGKVTFTITLMNKLGAMLTSFEYYVEVRNALYNEDDYISEEDLSGYRDLLNRSQAALEKIENMTTKDALPNPYALNLSLDGHTYNYNGADQVDVELGNLTYLSEDPSTVVPSIDETSAKTAVDAAARAAQSEFNAKVSETKAKESEDKAKISETNAKADANAIAGAVGQSAAYATQCKAAADKLTIIDNLNTQSSGQALSARMGALLEAKKINYSDLPTPKTTTDSKNLAHGGTFRADLVDYDEYGHIKEVTKETYTLPDVSGKQDVLTAGTGIDITNNVISSTGSNVAVDPKLTTGVNIATISVDGVDTDLYAPQGGGGSDLKFEGTKAEWEALPDTEKALYDGQFVAIKDDFLDTNKIQREIEQLDDEKANNGSSAYDETKSYWVTQHCRYNGKLWRCLVACSGVEPTEGTYWTEVSLASLDNDIKWKLVGTTTTTKNLSLPSEWNELCVYVAHNANVGGTLIIPKQLLSLKSYFSQVDWQDIGSLTSAKLTFFRVSFSGNVISLTNSFLNGADDGGIAVAYVYYR